MAERGVAFIEVHDEQGELVHRFTVTEDEVKAYGGLGLSKPYRDAIDAIKDPLSRTMAEALRRGR